MDDASELFSPTLGGVMFTLKITLPLLMLHLLVFNSLLHPVGD